MKHLIFIIFILFSSIVYAGDIPTLIKRKANKYGVDPKLAYAIAVVESSLDPKAIGKYGEIGLFQLRPEYHDVRYDDVNHNIEVAVKYLAYVKRRCYPKYFEAWFICYNLGPNNDTLIKYPRKFRYYVKVMTEYKKVRI